MQPFKKNGMEEIELEVTNYLPQTQGESFNLILKEKNGERFLPVIIGLSEGKLIVMEINHIKMKRPFAHDIIIQLCNRTNCIIEKVVIDDYKDGIFYVHIHIRNGGNVILLDARVSDAVVIALKLNVPIYVLASILGEAGYTKSGRVESRPDTDYDDLEGDDDDDNNNELEGFWNENDSPEEIEISDQTDFTQYSTSELQQLLQQALDTENYEVAALIDAEINKRPRNEK